MMSGRHYSEHRRPGKGYLSGGRSAIAKKACRPRACDECRKSKTKCSMTGPCETCQRRMVECSLPTKYQKVDESSNSAQSSTSCGGFNFSESAMNPVFSGHLRRLSAMTNEYIAPITAPGRNDMLRPELKPKPRMAHWVVYERFDLGKLVYSGLGESCCVSLDCVRGLDKMMLQAMEQHQCLLSDRGYYEECSNALTMLFRDIV
ncbi:hypothetical protein JMJ78_0000923, partial [Colletotrichum scovillei]